MDNKERMDGDSATRLERTAKAFENRTDEAKEKIAEIGASMSQGAQKIGSGLSNGTDQALSSVGKTMTNIAGSIRKNTPTEGTIGSAAGAVADRLESSGEYLARDGVKKIERDLVGIIRRNPVQSLWIGLGVGVLLGRALTTRK